MSEHSETELSNLLLPEGFHYCFISFEEESENFHCTFKIKLHDEESAMEWLKAYQLISKTSWRKVRGTISQGRINLYRGWFRCHHNTNFPSVSPRRISKNTNCEAKLDIVIKRYFDVPKHKSPSEETKEFPCTIQFHGSHNHPLDSGIALRFRSMSESTKKKLLNLFKNGHTAASAKHALETELLLDDAENYETRAADTAIIPTLSKIQHLLNKYEMDNESQSDGLSYSGTDKFSTNLPIESEEESQMLNESQLDVGNLSGTDMFSIGLYTEFEELLEKFDEWNSEFCNRITKGLQNNPGVFIPAVKKLLLNSKEHTATETGLISAMCNFGNHTEPSTLCMKSNKRRSEKISAQPTSVKRTKTTLSGIRRLASDEKLNSNLKEHKNVNFVYLSAAK